MTEKKIVKPKFLGYFAGIKDYKNFRSGGHFLSTASLLAAWMKLEMEATSIINISASSRSRASFEFNGELYIIQPDDTRKLSTTIQEIVEQGKWEISVDVTPVFESKEKLFLY